MERLQNHSWPGNIRELESVLKQALLQASGQVLLPTFLPEPLGCASRVSQAAPKSPPGVEAFTIEQRLASDVRDLYADAHKQLDRLLLPRVLEYARGSQRQSALLLGIARQTLRQKTQELGLAVPRLLNEEETTF